MRYSPKTVGLNTSHGDRAFQINILRMVARESNPGLASRLVGLAVASRGRSQEGERQRQSPSDQSKWTPCSCEPW